MQAGGARAGVSPQKTPRLTRAAAARQTQQQQPEPATGTTTSPTSERKRRRTPPLEAPAPQRASARQLKQRADVTEGIPPAVVASTSSARPTHTRSRSASQESNETLVASSSSSSLSSSRAASVLSADTVVVVEVVSDARGKGKGRLIAPVLAAEGDGDADVAPMDTDGVAGTGMVTRSRTKKVPEAKPATRKAPYPATMGAQLAAGRGKGSKAPTGKRKVAKSKAK